MTKKKTSSVSLLDAALIKTALWGALAKLSPFVQWRNPVMFIVYIGSIFTTLLWLHALNAPQDASMRPAFVLAITVWLWFTCCLPTLPRRWQKAAARRKPHRCAA